MFRLRSFSWFLPLLLAAAPLSAQMDSTFHQKATIRLDVIYPNGAHAGPHLRAQLRRGIDAIMVAMDQTSSSGNVEFNEVDPGQYNIRVSGDGIEPSESGMFTLEDTRTFMSVRVVVKPSDEDQGAEMRGGASISVVDLNVPKKAQKEFEHGENELSQENWEKAIEHLNKAIQIYPQYSLAYNDLGICYGHLKQYDKERDAFIRAINANQRCVPALVNLAHMDMQNNRLAEATGLLEKATSTEPESVQTLSLTAQLDFMQGRYEQAIMTAHKVHGLPHQHFAIVHYVAASAYQKQGHTPEAIGELQLFLQEEPQGPRADAVRKVMGEMQSSLKQSENQPHDSDKASPVVDANGGAR